MIHCARLVCSSATGPSPTAQVQHSHWSPGNSGSHPSWGWMSQQYRGFWVSRLLEFPVLISNRVTNRSGTDTSAQTTLCHCHNQSLQQPSENQEGYPHLTFPTKTLKHSGFPNLNSPHSPGSRTWIQTQSVPRGASICPWLQSLCSSPCACAILTTGGGGTVWFRPSDEDLLKYTLYIPQTSFIHTHPILLSWW